MGTPVGVGSLKEVASGAGGRARSLHVRWTPSVDFIRLRTAAGAKGRPAPVSPTLTHVALTVTSERDTIIAPTLHARKPVNREVRQPAQGHTASKC